MINNIAINFHDNDFWRTYEAFGMAMKEMIHNKEAIITKELIRDLWNESCYGLYVLYQNQFKYNSDDARKSTGIYLQLGDTDDIYINEEANEYLKNIHIQNE